MKETTVSKMGGKFHAAYKRGHSPAECVCLALFSSTGRSCAMPRLVASRLSHHSFGNLLEISASHILPRVCHRAWHQRTSFPSLRARLGFKQPLGCSFLVRFPPIFHDDLLNPSSATPKLQHDLRHAANFTPLPAALSAAIAQSPLSPLCAWPGSERSSPAPIWNLFNQFFHIPSSSIFETAPLLDLSGWFSC